MMINDAAGFSALSLVLGEDVAPQEATQEVKKAKMRHRQRRQNPDAEMPDVLPEYTSPKYTELPDSDEGTMPSPGEAAAAIMPAAATASSPDAVPVEFSPTNLPVQVTSNSSVVVPIDADMPESTPDENAAAEVGPASPPAAPPAPAAAPAAPETYHPGGQSVFVASDGGTSPWIYAGIAAAIGIGIFIYLKKK